MPSTSETFSAYVPSAMITERSPPSIIAFAMPLAIVFTGASSVPMFVSSPVIADTACPTCGATPSPLTSRAKQAVAGALLLATAGCVYGTPDRTPDAGNPDVHEDAGQTDDGGA